VLCPDPVQHVWSKLSDGLRNGGPKGWVTFQLQGNHQNYIKFKTTRWGLGRSFNKPCRWIFGWTLDLRLIWTAVWLWIFMPNLILQNLGSSGKSHYQPGSRPSKSWSASQKASSTTLTRCATGTRDLRPCPTTYVAVAQNVDISHLVI
jgi:hypothetical protein